MKFSTLAILPALAVIAAAPDGQERLYSVASFQAVDVASPDDVTVRPGPTVAVMAQGGPAVLRDLRVSVRDDTLFIARDSGAHRGGARLTVTLPGLRSVRAAGTGVVTVTAVKGRAFAGEMAGTGRLVITGMDGADAMLISRGTGGISAGGRVDTVRIESDATGNTDVRGLVVRRARISSHGTGDIAATVRDEARVSATGTGRVTVTGGARCTVEDGGTTRVTCG